MNLKPRLLASAALVGSLAAAPAVADTILVTTLAAEGEGSLAAALDAAATSNEPSIVMITEGSGEIALTEGLVYTGAAPLTIIGNGTIVSSAEDLTLLTTTATQELNILGLAFTGPGGWSIENRADGDGTAGKGIFMDVPDDADGTVILRLTEVLVRGVASHGIHISDCTLADECGGGSGGAGEGSAASIALDLNEVVIEDVGFGRFDSDGLRVDERGEGSIQFRGVSVTVRNVGADGIELDEGQAGNVEADILHSTFLENGAYCLPELLEAFMPEVDEAEFDEGTTAADAIPGPVTGSPDDACFEREVDLYDDGTVEAYEFGIDVDDGFDIDEAGPGSLLGSFTVAEMSGNLDEGFDFDEEGPGDIDVVFTGISGAENTDDAIKLSEEDQGDVYLVATGVEAISNGGVGIVAEEADDGSISVALLGVATVGNDDGELGVEVVQEDAGEGIVYVIDSEIADGIDTDGAAIDVD